MGALQRPILVDQQRLYLFSGVTLLPRHHPFATTSPLLLGVIPKTARSLQRGEGSGVDRNSIQR
jgi:hypothetical protein